MQCSAVEGSSLRRYFINASLLIDEDEESVEEVPQGLDPRHIMQGQIMNNSRVDNSISTLNVIRPPRSFSVNPMSNNPRLLQTEQIQESVEYSLDSVTHGHQPAAVISFEKASEEDSYEIHHEHRHKHVNITNKKRPQNILQDSPVKRSRQQIIPQDDYREETEEISSDVQPDDSQNDKSDVCKELLLGSKWYTRYNELVEFWERNGNCNVKQTYEKNLALGKWVANQRVSYRMHCEGKPSFLSNERIEHLERLGFDWNPSRKLTEQWQHRYNQLIEFKNLNGHCNVPKNYKANLALGIWIAEQRAKYKKTMQGRRSCMTKERIQALEKIGFVWSPGNKLHNLWQRRYEDLLEFKKKHGHCNVSREVHNEVVLGRWVSQQRSQYKKRLAGKANCITEYRIKCLEKVGFQWRVPYIGRSRERQNQN